MYNHEDDDDDDDKESPKENPQEGFVGKLLKSRTVIVSDQITQEVAEKVITQLLIMDAESNDPIKMIITSPGGHVDSGYAIHDMMKFIKSPIYAVGAGWVASIAVPIMMGAKKQFRYSLPNTRYLIHQPSGGAGGQAADLRIEAQEIIKIRKKLNKLIAAETGQPEDKVAQDSDRNFWMNAEEALTYGLVAKIITSMDELGS